MSIERLAQLLWEAGIPVAYIEGSDSEPVVTYGPAATAEQVQQGESIVAALPQTLESESAAAASAAANESSLQSRVDAALSAGANAITANQQRIAVDDAYLPGAGTASAGQVRAQVEVLTRQASAVMTVQNSTIRTLSALIRLQRRLLSSADVGPESSTPR